MQKVTKICDSPQKKIGPKAISVAEIPIVSDVFVPMVHTLTHLWPDLFGSHLVGVLNWWSSPMADSQGPSACRLHLMSFSVRWWQVISGGYHTCCPQQCGEIRDPCRLRLSFVRGWDFRESRDRKPWFLPPNPQLLGVPVSIVTQTRSGNIVDSTLMVIPV